MGGPKVISFINGISGPSTCQSLCLESENCGYFVWRSFDGRCHMVEDHPDLYYNGLLESEHISGPKECPGHAWTTTSEGGEQTQWRASLIIFFYNLPTLAGENCYTKGDLGGHGKIMTGFEDSVSGPRACQDLCFLFENCGFFVWRSYDGRCHFMKYNSDLFYNGQLEEDHVSGPKKCPPNSWTTDSTIN